jgi:hypothetical protein
MEQELSDIISKLPTSLNYEVQGEFNERAYVSIVTDLIKARLTHCKEQLLANIDHAVATESGQMVWWKGGHFSAPVYEYMLKFLEHPTRDAINGMIAEQALRSLYDEGYFSDKWVFYALTEDLLIKF